MRLDLFDRKGNLVATRLLPELAAGRLGIPVEDLPLVIKSPLEASYGGLTARKSPNIPVRARPWIHPEKKVG